MNIKKIISSALVVLILFGSIVGFIPVTTEAAHSPSLDPENNLTVEDIQKIVKESYTYDFENTAEMLAYELGKGYLDYVSSKGGKYTIYINRYTGLVYYVNNVTGQILSSNPSNPAVNKSDDVRMDLMSQLSVSYSKQNGSSSGTITYLSSKWAGEYAQIYLSKINSGIRVNYTFGDTSTRFIVPGQITMENYYEHILYPMIFGYEEALVELIGGLVDESEILHFFDAESWGKTPRYVWEDGIVGQRALQEYLKAMNTLVSGLYSKRKITKAQYDEIYAHNGIVLTVSRSFSAQNPAKYDPSKESDMKTLEEMYKTAPLTKDGIVVYVRNSTSADAGNLRKIQNYILQYTSYNKELLEEHEMECGFVETLIENFVFRCSVEYSFNEDGSLSVRLPSNSITFDDVQYMVTDVTLIPYFGAGNLRNEGYLFIPDGSGAIVEFDDFWNNDFKTNLAIDLQIYGDDFTYSTPSGYHKEQVTTPVFGIVSTEMATDLTKLHSKQDSFKTGYLAVIEEGASISTLRFRFGGPRHHYANAYVACCPYPNDVYNLSDTITVSGVTSYRMVAKEKYTGSYTTRFLMLGDTELGMASGDSFYPATYVGMASYYRDYLKERGDITQMEEFNKNLPLYVEALGSMNVVEKILTFPVTVSKPLTTFEDVITMYDEFARAKEKLLEKANTYREMSAKEVNNSVLREKYLKRAEEYEALSASLENINNINFKLTGFANGGMYFTYPTNVRWESACGGDAGMNTLIAATKDRTAGDAHFAIYPEFDFMYMSNSALFDGINDNVDLARMLDNRFASKKEYNSVIAVYESLFSLVISSDSLDKLYTTFNNSYKGYGIPNLSVSTLGSDVNSNLNVDYFISREDSKNNVVNLLDRISGEYDVMLTKGNSYAVPFADHILEIVTDSSHLAYSSYTIPFTGLVLHSYVNYTGAPLNYTGSPNYDILRSIENGASLYYILCYQNTNFMKEDNLLNSYYGVDYENWYDDVIMRYNQLNTEIGDLQAYEIVDHKTLIAERIIDQSEVLENNAKLKAEFIELVKAQILDLVNEKFDSVYGKPEFVGVGVQADINVDTLIEQASVVLNIDKADLQSDFKDELLLIKADFNARYPEKAGALVANLETVEYTTQYKYVTNSYAEEKDYEYVYTDYTVDNDRVVLVTYHNSKTNETTFFILNYNVYDVEVKLAGYDKPFVIEKYGYHREDL